MNTLIDVINIPSSIYDNVHKSYDLKENLDIKAGEKLIIHDYIQRRVYLDSSSFTNGVTGVVYTYEKLGNKIKLEFNVINVNHILRVEDYKSQNIRSYTKVIKVEFTKYTVDEIKKLVSIDNEISKKQIDFGDTPNPYERYL